jgi:hypothetical protein
MPDETDLVISGDGIPPYSAIGVTQTLSPIEASAQIARTINGTAINLSPTQFRKFKSELSCTANSPPAFAGLWPGSVVTIDCIEEIAYLTATGSPSVGGSPVPDRTVVATRTLGAYTFARLRLTMMVVAPWQKVRSEAKGTTEWTILLEEL